MADSQRDGFSEASSAVSVQSPDSASQVSRKSKTSKLQNKNENVAQAAKYMAELSTYEALQGVKLNFSKYQARRLLPVLDEEDPGCAQAITLRAKTAEVEKAVWLKKNLHTMKPAERQRMLEEVANACEEHEFPPEFQGSLVAQALREIPLTSQENVEAALLIIEPWVPAGQSSLLQVRGKGDAC